MSQFDKYTKTEYVEALRVFLALKKQGFLDDYGFRPEGQELRRGRLDSYEEAPIRRLEDMANAKAARCEAPDCTMGERYQIARDYLGLGDSDVSRMVGPSREMVRRWANNMSPIGKNLDALAKVLNVPAAWLEHGGEQYLPANSHIGVRVGEEQKYWKEQLFAMTQVVYNEIPEGATESYIQAYIEWAVFNKPEMSKVARRAGGRWHLVQGNILFSPWVAIPEHGLHRRLWSDEVESIIQEELATKPSVYSAWDSLKKRCEAMGLSESEYPKRISLHKRVEKERERAERFGVDLNSLIAASVSKHIPS